MDNVVGDLMFGLPPLLQAYDNQINELIAHEVSAVQANNIRTQIALVDVTFQGEGTKLERQLKVKLSKVKRLNTDKADRGARKLLS